MNFIKNMKIRTKLFVFYLALIIFLVCVLSFFSYRAASLALSKQTSQTLDSVIQKSIEQMDAFLEVCKRDLRELSTKPITQMAFYLRLYTKSLSSVEDDYRRYMGDRPYISRIRLFTIGGDELLTTAHNNNAVRENQSQKDWFRQIVESNDIYVSDMYMAEDGNLVMTMSKLLLTDEGERLGVLAIDIRGSSVTSFVDRIVAGKNGYGYIINKEGFLIAHPVREKILSVNILETSDPRLVNVGKDMMRMNRGMGRYEYEGVEKYVFYAPYKRFGWSVAVTIPDKELLAEAIKLRAIIFLLGLVAIIAAVAISVFVSRSITKPIEKLRDGTEIIGAGNLEYRVGTDAEDEVGQLSRAFDRMAENLKKVMASRDELNREIAERRLVEEKLRESENRYRLIFDKANDAILLMNGDRFVDCNEKTLELFGCRREQILNKPPYLFSPPTQPDGRDSTEKAMEKINAALTGQPQKFEWVHTKYDGTEFFAEVTLNTFDIKGQLHILAIVRDITERKQAEQRIEKSRQVLQKMIDAMPFGVVVVGKDKIIKKVNTAVVRLTGYSEDELVGHKCHKTLCIADEGRCPILDTNQSIDLSEKQLVTKDGRKVPIIKSAVELKFDDEEILLEAFVDISRQKEAEEGIKKLNKELEDANQELKNFVYIASHDLREPLRKITAFGSMLKKSLEGKLAADDAENLQFMIDGAERMAKMIEGLLIYSRLSSQAQPFQTVDLNEIVKQIQQFELAVLIEEKRAVIDVQQLPSVIGDPTQIRQLMQNLIANGIKYQRDGNIPRIIITSKPAAEEGFVRVEVTDNGIGIKPECQGVLFTMFRRLHKNDKYGGMGIGLAVCKKIIERHGGKIGVESQDGSGSTFWFTIRAATAPVSVASVPSLA